MTREQIEINRRAIIEELRATKCEGVEGLIEQMDKSGFFTARCEGHDDSDGGSANHSLWVLRFARQLYGSQAYPEHDVPEESLTIACLCHELENYRFPVLPNLVHGDALQALLHDADRLSIEYADSIPFGTEATKVLRKRKADKYLDIIFDQDDHRMWAGAQGRDDVFDGTETLAEFPVHHVLSIPVRPEGKGKDVLVLFDDNSFYSLMYLSEEGGRGEADLYRSDKVMFGYSDLVFFITRYPQYRSSYIAARNAKGLWGVIRIRENRKDNGDHQILQERVVDFTWRSSEKAVEHMRSHSGNLIRVLNSDFYTRISL